MKQFPESYYLKMKYKVYASKNELGGNSNDLSN